MLELGWGLGEERGCHPAASLDDDPMLLEFQLAQAFAAPTGGSTVRPEVDSRGEAEITFGPSVQLAAPEQASDETQLVDAVNISATVDLPVTASAVATDNIVYETVSNSVTQT